MGIDLATWRARIGLNYYHACRPLQTRWRSSGGRLYQPGVARWGVGEIMNDTPMVLKGCMAVVALSLILTYIVHTCPKLKGRSGGGKLRCHWHRTTSQVTERVGGGGTLLLKAFVVVIALLLIMAGDVELNPGPDEPSLKALLNELHPVRASWYYIGVELDIPHTTLNCFKLNHSDPTDLMREMLSNWLDTAVDPRPTWEAIIIALRSPIVDKKLVAEQLELKYCKPVRHKMKESNNSGNVEQGKELHDENTASSMTVSQEKPMEDQRQHSYAPTPESTTTSTNRYSSSCTPPPSEVSQKPPFGCGCGKCTFLKFMEGGCPNPIATVSSFPYLNLRRLNHEQQQELIERLRFESRKMIMRFQELVSTTIKSLKSQQVPPDELVSHIMTLGAFDPVIKEPQVPLFQHCFKELKNANTIPQVFLVLNNYISFFNYDIVEHIIKVLGTQEDRADLQRYKEDFNQYANRRVYECRPQFGPVSETNHADIFVKVDSRYDNYTLAEIKGFCNKLSEILRVSSGDVLRLCRVEKGCLQLTFQVPSFVQLEIFPLSREQERALASKGITRLTCGEYQFPEDSAEELQFDSDASGKEIEAYELERKIPQLDIDKDSAMGISISTGRKSTTLSEDSLDKEIHELDYELRVQGLEGAASPYKYVGGLELHRAARMGQLETVKFLVEKKHCTPLYRDQNGDTALHLAAVGGSLEVVKYFVTEANCDAACLDQLGLTPLHLASQHGHLHIVQYLVSEQQIDPECKDQYGNTPLHRACTGGHLRVVKFVITQIVKYTHSILSDIKDKWNSTPLHKAARNGHIDVVKFLTLEMHCDPTSRNADNATALHLAVANGHLDIIRFFISEQNCDPNIPGQYGGTPLHYAAEFGHHHIVKYFTVEKQCDPVCRDSEQNTPLHKAAWNDHIDVVKFLTLEMHCDPTSRNAHNATALHLAVVKGHLDIIRFFISEQNCDPNIPGQYGGTPLHYAAAFGHLHTVKYFTVEKQCDPVCRDPEQNTPLHKAAWNGHIDVVKFLTLEMHCDPTSRNADNATALHLAVANGHLDMVRFFMSEQNCDPNIPGWYRDTPIHYAADFRHSQVFTDEQDFNLMFLNDRSQIPLHWAAREGQMDTVKFLTVEKHCDSMYRD